jgi:hypothetical protein
MSQEPLYCAALFSNKSLLLTLDIEGITAPQLTLIDSGSSANFIDGQFACQHSLPLIELDSPCHVIGINGKEVKDSIRFKCKLSFTSQNQNFSATFYCLPLGDRQLILGMPWLHEANPDINWKSLSITIPQIESAKLAESVSASKELPPEFQEFTEVFGEEFFTKLPPHRPYDCAIPLKEGEEVPYGPIYPMTPRETEVLKEYLENEEKAGKLRKSYSPAGAPVMFVEKADGSLHLVVDYRRLNNITIKDRHPLPLQEELIEKLKQCQGVH